MKRKLAALLAAAMLIGMVGCSANKEQNRTNSESLPVQKTDEQVVSELIDVISSSPKESSSAADYIAAHKTEYDSIIAMGSDGVKAIFKIFEQGGQTGLKGAIMESICGGFLTGENIGIIVDNAQQWYDEFKRHIIRIANLNSVDFMKEYYPKSYVLLEALDFENKGYDSSAFLQDGELVTADGIKNGMTYEQVVQIIGTPEKEYVNDKTVKSIEHGGIHYGFCQIDDTFDENFGLPKDGNFYLVNISMTADLKFDGAAPRNIRIGDNIEDVFTKFPVRDTALKKWASQKIYGTQRQGKQRGTLEFTTILGAYRMYFVTEKQVMNVNFDKQNKVKSIELIWEKG